MYYSFIIQATAKFESGVVSVYINNVVYSLHLNLYGLICNLKCRICGNLNYFPTLNAKFRNWLPPLIYSRRIIRRSCAIIISSLVNRPKWIALPCYYTTPTWFENYPYKRSSLKFVFVYTRPLAPHTHSWCHAPRICRKPGSEFFGRFRHRISKIASPKTWFGSFWVKRWVQLAVLLWVFARIWAEWG